MINSVEANNLSIKTPNIDHTPTGMSFITINVKTPEGNPLNFVSPAASVLSSSGTSCSGGISPSPVVSSLIATPNAQSPDIKEKADNRDFYERLTPMLCHEIRGSLQGFYGSTYELELQHKKLEEILNSTDCMDMSPKAKKEMLKIIDATKPTTDNILFCARLQQVLIDKFLSLSKLQQGKLQLNIQEINLKKIINQVNMMNKNSTLKKNVTIYTDMPKEDIIIYSDGDCLTQILVNLVSNAIKFAPEGAVQISFKGLEEQGVSFIEFSVSDNGKGMTAEEVGRLFVPYAQASPTIASEYGGTGLGLSICKELIELMGGKGNIKVYSQPKEGSTFTFRIKNHEPPKPQLSPGMLNAYQLDSKDRLAEGKQILLVDDHIVNQKMMKECLIRAGHKCITAGDGQEAVELSQKQRFDLVLMDIHMPKMGGLEASQHIKMNTHNLSKDAVIVILSGEPETPEFMESLRKIGITHKPIVKPIKPALLLAQVASILEQKVSIKIGGLS